MYSQDKGTPIGYNVSISNFLLRWMQLLVNLKQWAGFQCLPPSYKVMGDQVPGGGSQGKVATATGHTPTHAHTFTLTPHTHRTQCHEGGGTSLTHGKGLRDYHLRDFTQPRTKRASTICRTRYCKSQVLIG